MNRRNVLIGLGGLVAGGGALVGTGAFDTVEAERSVTVETAEDADAFLALEPAERGDETDDASENAFVEQNDDGLLEITFGDDDGAAGGGLNLNARTMFEELFVIRNQGTQTVNNLVLDFVEDDPLADTVTLQYVIGGGGDTAEATRNPGHPEEDLDPQLGLGDEITVGFEFDLIDQDIDVDEFDLTLQITAEEEAA